MLKSIIRNYNDECILVSGTIKITGDGAGDDAK